MKYAFETEQQIADEARRGCIAKAAELEKPADPQVVDNWVRSAVERAREAGRILTAQQLADYKNDRTLALGDKARYIGPEREELVGNDRVTRPHGQIGTVTNVVKKSDEEQIITFQPRPQHSDDHIVELVIKTNTRGYFDLERIP